MILMNKCWLTTTEQWNSKHGRRNNVLGVMSAVPTKHKQQRN